MSDADRAAESFYTLDAEDCIVECGGPAWSAFASDNGGPAAGQAVHGDARRRAERRGLARRAPACLGTAMAVEVASRELPGWGRADFLRCSICNRLRKNGAQDWREPDEAGAVGSFRVVHTVCKDCRSGISARAPRRPEAAD